MLRVTKGKFPAILHKKYICCTTATPLNCLIEAILMNTRSICFHGEMKKILYFKYHQIPTVSVSHLYVSKSTSFLVAPSH